MTVEMKPVASSNIKSVGYDAKARRLHIIFHGTDKTPPREYHHDDVSQADFDALLGDGKEGHSVGKHYAAHVRGKFPHRLVT